MASVRPDALAGFDRATARIRWPVTSPRALVLSKLLDGATTAVGLLFVPAVAEANPLLRRLVAVLGIVPGVVLGTLVVVGTVVLVTEAGVLACQRLDPEPRRWGRIVRTVGYGPLTVVFAIAAVNNLVLIAWGLRLVG